MIRYFLEISFDGTAYHGWQKQKNGISVQQIMEEKLSLKLKNPIEVIGCGRTDTGVHARQFYLHFDLNEKIVLDDFLFKLNRFLPHDIAAHSIHIVKSDANARFSALERSYNYYIQTQKSPFNRNYSYDFTSVLDLDRMNNACKILMKNEDFTSFSKLHGGQKNNLCRLTECKWQKNRHQLIFTISANRFTRNMVRAIVGTMIEVGKGNLSVKELTNIIESRNRCMAGESVEAKGLFLEKITYPAEIFISSFRLY